MKKTSPSLLDVLEPPPNPWLEKVREGESNRPDNVRVVRSGGADDLDAPVRLRAAKKKLRDFIDL